MNDWWDDQTRANEEQERMDHMIKHGGYDESFFNHPLENSFSEKRAEKEQKRVKDELDNDTDEGWVTPRRGRFI